MSDPDAIQQEPTPPPQPPRPAQRAANTTAQSQLEADEQYARQLAEHYNGQAGYAPPRAPARGQGGQARGYTRQDPYSTRSQRPRGPQQSTPLNGSEREPNFFDGGFSGTC